MPETAIHLKLSLLSSLRISLLSSHIQTIQTAILLSSLLLLTSCFHKDNTVMRVGTNLWPGYEPLYLAKALRYHNSEEIRLVEYPSASEVIRAFRNKTLEAATLTMDEVLTLHVDNIDAVIVLVLDISDGGDVIITTQDIKTIEQLDGKTIAVESTALGAYVLSRALEIHQMSIDNITIKSLDYSEHEQAFIKNQVDAAVTFEPVRTKLLKYGGNEVFSSKQIPGEIVDVLVVRRDFLNNNQDKVKQLLLSWFKAIEFIEQSPQQAAHMIAKRLKINSKEVLNSYQGLKLCDRPCNLEMLNPKDGSLKTTIMQLAHTMVDKQLLKHKPPLVNIFDAQLLTGEQLTEQQFNQQHKHK